MNTKLRIGVIGAGRIGKIHAETIATRLPNAVLAGVADINQPEAAALAARFGVPLHCADFRELLDAPSIDAVAICSATDSHAQIIQEAAAAGKQIFCEKPIDHDLQRIDAALAAVARAGVALQIGFNRRFDANFARVQAGVAAGEIGEPHILRLTSRDPAPPPIDYITNSGGIFLDMTIHDFDMARFLIGSEVEEVYVAGGVRVDPAIGEAGDLDTVIIMLKFANGVIGTIDNSRQAVYGYDQRAEVFGSGGMISAENNRPDTHVLSTASGVSQARPLYFFLERYMAAYVAEMGAFVDAVLAGAPVPVGGADGRVPVVMGLAARKSWAENRPVRLAEITA